MSRRLTIHAIDELAAYNPGRPLRSVCGRERPMYLATFATGMVTCKRCLSRLIIVRGATG